MKKIVRLTESDLIKLVKRVISEQPFGINDYMSKPGSGVMTNNAMGWEEVKKGLQSFMNPKVINSGGVESLNWGTHNRGGSDWGLSINNTPTLPFQTTNQIKANIFNKTLANFGMKSKSSFSPMSKNYSSDIDLDYSNPKKIIDMVKQLVDSLSRS